eukprot:Sdes_comp20198_c0_seq5m13503
MICEIFRGSIIHSLSLEDLEIIQDGVLGIDAEGVILFCEPFSELAQLENKFSFTFNQTKHKVLQQGEFLIPGFVDTHCHAPQYPNMGVGTDLPLLKWLEKYTFPLEARLKNIHLARDVFLKCVSRSIANGTTLCSYFGTLDCDATLELAKICNQLGQRALVGKVNMNQMAPDYYTENSCQQSVKETLRFLQSLAALKLDLVEPILTPRFAVSCSEELLTEIGNLARRENLRIQSHLSETIPECALVENMYPDSSSYTHVYQRNGILGPRTVMAHCNYLSDSEFELLSQTKTSIAHCPNSNFTMGSGVCFVGKALQAGISVGLGTDVSGGTCLSILNSIRFAMICSQVVRLREASALLPGAYMNQPRFHKMVDFEQAPASLSVAQVFYLATLGGAQALSMAHLVGNFEPGKQFDALVVDPFSRTQSMEKSPVHFFEGFTLMDNFQKFLISGDDRNISQVYVKGVQRKKA